MAGLPEGTLTFLLTDLVASTSAWEESPPAMRDAMAHHDRILAASLKLHRGIEVPSGRAGDSILAVFRTAADAAACALSLQRDFASAEWPPGTNLEIRVALHTGEAQLRGDQYHGQALNRCARLLATCHGGQVLVTEATQLLLVDELPPRAALRDLGLHRLKDLGRLEHVFQLVDIDRPAEFPPIRSLSRRLTNLPVQLTTFVGRQAELRQLLELHRRTRLITLTGPGGSGKTRLALQLASELTARHADGVWLIELAPLSDPLHVPQAVVAVLGLKEQAGRRLTDTLADYLRERNLLLVLDNCEHVVDVAAEVAVELLTRCEGLSFLVTSREPLNVPGELTWRVPPLGRGEALRLFADRAMSHEPRFRVTDENVDIVRRICQRLDRIPLAIELAAARVAVMSPEEILDHLETRFSLLVAGSRTSAGRHRTLKAAIDWSYELLAEPEKVLFRRISIFVGRFSLEAAEAVCGDTSLSPPLVLDLLGRLVDKSMVILDDGHYRCLETIRAYGRQRLLEAGELDPQRERLGAHLVNLAKVREPGRLAAWLDQMETAHDDIRATLTWSVRADPELGMQLALALVIFWQYRGHTSEPRQFAEAILENVSTDFSMRPSALQLAGAFAYLQADFAAARRLLPQSLEAARAAGDRLTVLRALEASALVATATRDVTASKAALDEALTLARELGEQNTEAAILYQLGLVASQQGDLLGARSLFEQSVNLRRGLGRNDESSMPLTFLAVAALMQGDFDTARRCIVESLDIGRTLRDYRAAWSLDVLACQTALEGRPERALRLAGAGSGMHVASGNIPPASWDTFVSQLLRPARDALGQEAAQAAWEAGRRMGYEEALEFAVTGAAAAAVAARS